MSTVTKQAAFDAAAGEAFVERVCGMLEGGAAAIMLSIGHRTGLFEAADGGTLFLDEIGDMPLALQAKLLRFLQERVVERIGGRTEIPVDVRVVCATNKNLQEAMAEGGFREDLYYRLKVIGLRVEPLRNRPEDIVPLAELFLKRLDGSHPARLAPDAVALVLRYPWPGNVRELKNAMAHASVFCERGVIHAAHLPQELLAHRDHGMVPKETGQTTVATDERQPLKQILAEFETSVLKEALARAGGDRNEAARSLRIPLRTLSWKMRRHRVCLESGRGLD